MHLLITPPQNGKWASGFCRKAQLSHESEFGTIQHIPKLESSLTTEVLDGQVCPSEIKYSKFGLASTGIVF
jgi:hypothetical protein